MDDILSSESVLDFLKLLAHDLRWKILKLLARSDYNGLEFVRLLGQPQNLVSYHLRKLHEQHLVREHRSTADERSIYYSLDLDTVRSLYQTAGEALHPALGLMEALPPTEAQPHQPPLRVLFLCTENSARSQMAEALLRHLSHGHIEAYSAGSHPTQVHPLARRVLEERGISTEELRSKSLDEFARQSFEVQNFTGSIGYVELPYALRLSLPYAEVQNAAGQYVAPSIEGALAAAASVENIPADLRFYIVNAPGATAYPISGYSWLIVYQQQDNADKGWALANLFWWMIHDGQQFSEPLHYAALPDTMVAKSAAQIRLMTCGSGHTPCYRG